MIQFYILIGTSYTIPYMTCQLSWWAIYQMEDQNNNDKNDHQSTLNDQKSLVN